MIYPSNFEEKIGFDKIRQKLKSLCLSSLGTKLVDEMEFYTEYEYLVKVLRLNDEMKRVLTDSDTLPISHCIDLTQVLSRLRIEGTYPDIEELYKFRLVLNTIKGIYNYFKRNKDKYPLWWEETNEIKIYSSIEEQIDKILSSDGRIKDNASHQLQKIRSKIQSINIEISKRMQQIMASAKASGWVDDTASVNVRDGRLVIPLDSAHKRKIKGFIYDESATGKTVYIEPAEIVELNNDLKELEHEERKEIVKILIQIAYFIRPYIDDLIKSFSFLAFVDFNRAKALYAIETNSYMPNLISDTVIEWYNAVHPLLYLHHMNIGKEVVAQNIFLNEKRRILVISGPNAGGKSVCLQTIGLLQYMIQCGILVSLKETSVMGLFKKIFIDIGDEQSIENDLSTYSSHLNNMKYFIENSDNFTLFLIDEFGSGTEPIVGGAIAESVLEELNKKKAFGIITTHYTNLKYFASNNEGVVNGAMLFDMQNLQPMFKLSIGEPGSSFAFEIARKTGLPETIIKLAETKVGTNYIDYDKNLKNIIRDKFYWQQKRNQIKETGKRLDEITSKYSNELEEIRKLRKEILEKAKEDAQNLLSNVNKTIENTIRIIKENQADKEKTREARQLLEQTKAMVNEINLKDEEKIARKIEQLKQREERKKNRQKRFSDKSTNEIKQPKKELAIGHKVKIKNTNTIGEIIEINDKNLTIAIGQMRTVVGKDQIEILSNNEYNNIRKTNAQPALVRNNDMIMDKKKNFKLQIDVRGMRANDALQAVSDYIDDAIIVDIPEVRILHGKGDGILRQMIRDYLKTVPLIKSFHDEHADRGGAGITVIHFDN